MSDVPLTGGCNCGAVRFEIERAQSSYRWGLDLLDEGPEVQVSRLLPGGA